MEGMCHFSSKYFHIFVEHLWRDTERSNIKEYTFQKVTKDIRSALVKLSVDKYLWNKNSRDIKFDDWIEKVLLREKLVVKKTEFREFIYPHRANADEFRGL